MWTGWVMGDTPSTVTITRAPAVLKMKMDLMLQVQHEAGMEIEINKCKM